MKEEKNIDDSAIWDEFWQAGVTSGSACRDCRHGTTFFGSEERGCFEDGELDDLLKKAEANPERYRDLGGGPHFVELFGIEWCWDCQKCRAEMVKYQTFIWENRRQIGLFLNARLKTEADRTAEEMDSLSVLRPSYP